MTRTAPPSHVRSVAQQVQAFVRWLQRFGETSFDHQTFFAGAVGGMAKRLYYRRPRLGAAAVAPLIACEAFLPSARRLFHTRTRFPIADAHYAMGFAFLYEATGEPQHRNRAEHFLEVLERSRCPGFANCCWGYPFDWVTRSGTIPAGTPLITTTPYVYEAFLQVNSLEYSEARYQVLQSTVRHVCQDIKDFSTSPRASSCSYTPYDGGGVVNAAAYRSFMLASACQVLGRSELWAVAERNLNFVLEAQNEDGSWPYAVDGVRDFVDHFHTCFVMKALGKIHALTGHEGCLRALERGLEFYLEHLFDNDGMPRPFAKAPRVTVYRTELYDCAECINLCVLLGDRFPQCESILETVVSGILRDWVKPDGSFRSRRLLWGWDNVPMHRWGQAQMFRSLAYYLRERAGVSPADSAGPGAGILEIAR